MLTHLDIFSGIGGFALAAKWAGFKTVGFCEIDPYCKAILNKHWPGVPVHNDIKGFHYNYPVDLMTGGFPCQPFSIAGKQKGTKDDRYLWPEFFRIIRETKPTWVIVENVPGVLALGLDDLLDDLASESYETETFLLPACAANAPHRRDRVWVIAYLDSIGCRDGKHHWERRPIQKNENWDMAALYQEWAQYQPKPWATYQAADWFKFNASIRRNDNGLPNRVDRIRALGNAIVPQAVYPFMKMITFLEDR